MEPDDHDSWLDEAIPPPPPAEAAHVVTVFFFYLFLFLSFSFLFFSFFFLRFILISFLLALVLNFSACYASVRYQVVGPPRGTKRRKMGITHPDYIPPVTTALSGARLGVSTGDAAAAAAAGSAFWSAAAPNAAAAGAAGAAMYVDDDDLPENDPSLLRLDAPATIRPPTAVPSWGSTGHAVAATRPAIVANNRHDRSTMRAAAEAGATSSAAVIPIADHAAAATAEARVATSVRTHTVPWFRLRDETRPMLARDWAREMNVMWCCCCCRGGGGGGGGAGDFCGFGGFFFFFFVF
jgi:hypothetical protein